MKPFNLDDAIIGAPIVTRDGESARFIAYVPETMDNSQLIVLTKGKLRFYFANGSFLNDGIPSSFDLFMAPIKKTVWVNFYQEMRAGYYYETEEQANKNAGNSFTRIGKKAHPVEIEI